MKRIALDIETTGLDPKLGHRIVEIGCIELENNYPTGKYFQQYINPEREMPEEALKIHGLSTEFLLDKPVFSDIVDKFISFVNNAELVIHNAKFDLGFLNYELESASKKNLDKFKIIDTLLLARKIFPGAANNLDALCRRYNIDISKRKKHGALLDAELLADVFLEMNGGRQQGFNLNFGSDKVTLDTTIKEENTLYCKKIIAPDREEEILHEKLRTKIKENSSF